MCATLALQLTQAVRLPGVLLALVWWSTALPAQTPEMVEVPAGAYTMGRDDGPEDERPAHRVDRARFLIDRLPVTNAQFAEFLDAQGLEGIRAGGGGDSAGSGVSSSGNSGGNSASNRYRRYDDDDNDARIHRVNGRWRADAGFERHPVNEVPWAGARDYCAWKNKRLPSEAEWEKAARGTDGRRYPWGNAAPDATRAKFASGWNTSAAVDAYPAGASPYGVLDMAGNQWEWVSSLYQPYPYRADDGRESLTADGVRGTRGGGHDSSPAELTTTQRGRTLSRAPRAGHHNIGFRCAR